jgi:uncharacterized membrane protein YiaA
VPDVNIAEIFNLAASLAVVTCGLVIDFFFRPRAFTEHPVARLSFQLWVLRWLLLVFGWLLFVAQFQRFHSSRWAVLLIVDSGSILTQGCCWSLFLGSQLDRDQVQRNKLVFRLVGGLLILTLWNCVFTYSDSILTIFSFSMPVWTLPSLILATFNALMIGYVFASRSKVPLMSLLVFVIQLAYAIWEVPAYTEIFSGKRLSDPVYSNTLATLKLLSGAVTYLIFCLPETNYGSINSGPADWAERFEKRVKKMFDPQLSPRLSSFLINIVSGLIATAIVSIVIAIYPWFERHLLSLLPKK